LSAETIETALGKAAGAAFGGERSERGAEPQRMNRALAHEVRPAEGGFHGLKAMEKRSRVLAEAVLAFAVAAGCAQPRVEAVAPARAAPRDVRRLPDGVVIDLPPSVPTAVARGQARGVLSLREPPGSDAVADLLQAFVDAWESESLDALMALLAPDAGPIDGPEHGRAALVESWRQRLRAHDYGHLAGLDVLRPERVQRWTWDELGTPDTPARPPGMLPAEILVRAPLEITRVAGEKVFGDALMMVLLEKDGKLRIAEYGEVSAP
jgi:hypothetical protein